MCFFVFLIVLIVTHVGLSMSSLQKWRVENFGALTVDSILYDEKRRLAKLEEERKLKEEVCIFICTLGLNVIIRVRPSSSAHMYTCLCRKKKSVFVWRK